MTERPEPLDLISGSVLQERFEADADRESRRELFTVNFGPHHPSTHGVLRIVAQLDGEIVKDVAPVIGYVHTGIEKTMEDKSYWKAIPVVERMDYLSYFFNALSYCMAVETLLGVEVPRRARYLRVIHCELCRIMSHLVWMGTGILDLGAMSVFFYAFRERDRCLDLFEMSAGQRMHPAYFQIGGVREDIPSGFEAKAVEFCRLMLERVGEYRDLLSRNEILVQRTRGVGVVSADRLLELGVTGPLLRAAGVPWDLRKRMPYCSYEEFEFSVPVGSVGDCYDRFACRIAEIEESCKIVTQAVAGLPEGDFITGDRKVALPPRSELAVSMEALIHHFKLVTEGFRVPAGEVYEAVEGPRGEIGCFVVADGSSKPARVHVRDASFVNLQALPDMCRGGYVADMIANLAFLDPILGGIDR